MNHIFHVHTRRCKHASDESDEQYIKTALSLGADKITFTDHTPFPGNNFKNRMEFSQLSEYIDSLKNLHEKYKNLIDIQIGLEVEFLPSKMDFYQQLKNDYKLDLLIIGQHFYEHNDGKYSFDDEKEFNNANEFLGCGDAIVQGIITGLFNVVAHPDRIFRRCKEWTSEMTAVSEKIIKTAAENNIILERNLSSYEKFITKSRTSYWKNEFWDLVEKYNSENKLPVKIIEGLDAHSTDEMVSRFKYMGIYDYNSAMDNILEMQADAEKNNCQDITLDEINAEIDDYGRGKCNEI